jgi:hypothetical protein
MKNFGETAAGTRHCARKVQICAVSQSLRRPGALHIVVLVRIIDAQKSLLVPWVKSTGVVPTTFAQAVGRCQCRETEPRPTLKELAEINSYAILWV